MDYKKKTLTGIPYKPRKKNRPPKRSVKLAHRNIENLRTVESHYSKTKMSGRRYLPYKTTLKYLWETYKKDMIAKHEPYVKFSTYKKIFKLYNIGKKPPKVDVCNFCTISENKIKTFKNQHNVINWQNEQQKLDLHKRRADRGYTFLRSYKGPNVKRKRTAGENYRPNQAAICIDLAQARTIPQLNTSVAFYKRKLMAYNCGIHNLNTGTGHMFVWPENLAKRGSNEVASCLYKYIDNCINQKIKELVIFSDNCAGQNKNFNLVLACLRLIQQGRFKKVTHIFMTAGHSYMPCDRDFGVISRELKNEEIYTFKLKSSQKKSKLPTKPQNFRYMK